MDLAETYGNGNKSRYGNGNSRHDGAFKVDTIISTMYTHYY